jgi:hypothetical protein
MKITLFINIFATQSKIFAKIMFLLAFIIIFVKF